MRSRKATGGDRSRLRRAVAMEGDLLGAGPDNPNARGGSNAMAPPCATAMTRVRRPGRGFHRWPAAAFSDWR